jgi:hypothetical protein
MTNLWFSRRYKRERFSCGFFSSTPPVTASTTYTTMAESLEQPPKHDFPIDSISKLSGRTFEENPNPASSRSLPECTDYQFEQTFVRRHKSSSSNDDKVELRKPDPRISDRPKSMPSNRGSTVSEESIYGHSKPLLPPKKPKRHSSEKILDNLPNRSQRQVSRSDSFKHAITKLLRNLQFK